MPGTGVATPERSHLLMTHGKTLPGSPVAHVLASHEATARGDRANPLSNFARTPRQVTS